MFNIFVCQTIFNPGSHKALKGAGYVERVELGIDKFLPATIMHGPDKVVHYKGQFYVFICSPHKIQPMTDVLKYLPSTGAWSLVAKLVGTGFCALGFMNSIIVIGGRINMGEYARSCLQFNTSDCQFTELQGMRQERTMAACSLFRGRIVVTGGEDGFRDLKCVESFDVLPGRWSPLPDMCAASSCHSSVVANDKMYVVGMDSCEVFDGIRFVSLRSGLGYPRGIFCSEGRVFVFFFDKLVCYDVEKNEWRIFEHPQKIAQELAGFSCVEIPLFSVALNKWEIADGH